MDGPSAWLKRWSRVATGDRVKWRPSFRPKYPQESDSLLTHPRTHLSRQEKCHVDRTGRARSPYTFIVLALLILIMSPVAILRTPTDIFPNINIPVIAVAWQFTGLNPEEMEGRITTGFERVLRRRWTISSTSNRERVSGQSIVRSPAAECAPRYRQRAGDRDRADRPPPAPARRAAPLIINFSASTVPIRSSPSPDVGAELNDVALNFLRTQLVTVPGASVPYPYGGKQRQVMVDRTPGCSSRRAWPDRHRQHPRPSRTSCCRPVPPRSGSSSTTSR